MFTARPRLVSIFIHRMCLSDIDLDVRRSRTLLKKALKMRMITKIAVAGTVVLLAGCGHSEPGRVQGGAAAGAATGATIGLIGGPPGVVGGALIGGGVGAVAGATTPARDVNLGPPVWKQQ
jgi:hypothetical protein